MGIIYTTYFCYQNAFYIVGTRSYDKLQAIIMKKSILNDVKKLSPDAQTSSLEGFHSTLNQWHPKMICFSWLGTYCRYVIYILLVLTCTQQPQCLQLSNPVCSLVRLLGLQLHIRTIEHKFTKMAQCNFFLFL